MNAAESQFNTAATPPGDADFSSSSAAMLHAKNGYAASLMTIQVADDLTKQVIDLIA